MARKYCCFVNELKNMKIILRTEVAVTINLLNNRLHKSFQHFDGCITRSFSILSLTATTYCTFKVDYQIFFESSPHVLGMLKRERSERLASHFSFFHFKGGP